MKTEDAAALHVTTASLPPPSSGVMSPRNEFFVSQRAATDLELSRLDSSLSLEEQEILATIQELQLQLTHLRAAEEQEKCAPPDAADAAVGRHQLIVVSNNLPVLLERHPQTGRWKATKTTGGLDKLMCLTGVRAEMDFLWVGGVGQPIPKSEHEAVRSLLLQHKCLPVFLSSDVASRHASFSSEVLWSLFHYVSEPVPLLNTGGNSSFYSTKRFNKQDWRAYESANESFADAIAEVYNEGDSVWVHDYHLMLLPSLLRQRIPLCRIGWFLHTPFPSSEVYCRLPVRSQLLTGVLQADLLGFQTFDYERHFLSTCHRLLGVECTHKGVRSALANRDHFASIGVFPIGISLEPFAHVASSRPTLDRVNELHEKFGGKRIILGIDRLDNIKGIPHKMLAMEMLLDRFPEWQHNVVLVQIGISSRSGVVDSGTIHASGKNDRLSSVNKASGEKSNVLPRSSSYSVMGPGGSVGSDSPIKGVPESPPTAASPIAAGKGKSSGYDACYQLEMSSHSYHNISTQVNQIVGRINGIFGTLDYAPIHFIQQQATPHDELCALYDLADVCLVTSTRDGMNLVSHEFVVCQQHFMRNKDERTKAARMATRESSGPGGKSNGGLASTSTSKALRDDDAGKSGGLSPIPSSQESSASVLTDWEGEDGGPGVLVVSEFAGCSQSLSGAIVINPWNTEDLARSMHQALSMCRTEREIRQQKLYRYVSSNTASVWGRQFLEELGVAVEKNRKSSTQLPKLDKKAIVRAYTSAQNRVIILDYDRTLTPQHSLLPLAAVGPNFKSLLDALTADERNTVFIVSGRERKFLETWLNGMRVGVAAEDGFFYRMNLSNTREQWKTMSKFQYDVASARSGGSTTATVAGMGSVGSLDTSYSSEAHGMMHMSMGSLPTYAQHVPAPRSADTGDGTPFATGSAATDDSFGGDDMSWKDLVLPTMLTFTDRTPGSYIEDKESSLTWHYGDADPHFGSWQAKDLQIILERQLIGTALEVYQGRMAVSVEHEGCTKTRVLEGILKHLSLPEQIVKKNGQEVDFVLCVCDDVTDDQMFQTLNALVTESNERHEERKRREEHAASERIRRNSIAMGNPAPVQLHARPVPSAAHVSKAKPRMPKLRVKSDTTDQVEPAIKPKGGTKKRNQNVGAAAAAVRGNEDDSTDDEDELDAGENMDDDNKVAFSRLQKVPVQLAENVAIFAVVVGPDVQHSGGRHGSSFAVDSLADVRTVLKDFVDESRKGSDRATLAPVTPGS
ncbi:unnamed protein product [Hyaloperonospora brassicae]|uniref:Trehalose-phosphatase n=1 Tax=Hyaloperonospora brassicae TaxID=162125 RepID=A0AAV0UIJ7_HYABA|nr:unnamed protein product [Hyaloperonospora brassicae]